MRVPLKHKINWKRVDLAVLIGAAFLVMTLFWTAPHWWKKVGEAKIIYNNEASSGSSLYRSRDGKLLLHLRAQDEEDLYVIYPDTQKVGIPNRSSFFMLPGYAYSKNVPPLVVFMDRTKVEQDPQLIIQDTFFEFTTAKGSRVRVTW